VAAVKPPPPRVAAVTAAVLAGLIASGCSAPAAAPAGPPSASASRTPTASVAAASPSATTASPSPSRTAAPRPSLRIGSVSNFRDVAGDGLALPGGKRMATGVVYRSGKLGTLSGTDRLRLEKAGLRLVIDLRTSAVSGRSPDPAVKGAAHQLVNIFGTANAPSLRTRTVAAAEAYMRDMNVRFVTDPGQRSRIGKAITLIARSDSPVLFHCTEGKDRSGWVAAVLQLAAGAGHDQVIAEYLKSNDYRAELITDAYRTTRVRSGTTAAQVDDALLRVDASYLEAGLGELRKRYGDIDAYLTDGLGLSRATIADLRSRLVG
jgi:protein-tyrosine phosphatase